MWYAQSSSSSTRYFEINNFFIFKTYLGVDLVAIKEKLWINKAMELLFTVKELSNGHERLAETRLKILLNAFIVKFSASFQDNNVAFKEFINQVSKVCSNAAFICDTGNIF